MRGMYGEPRRGHHGTMSSEPGSVSQLPPLPERPDFPVYGLAASFPGQRWLEVWNTASAGAADGSLWHVNLGHGDPHHDGPILVTITDAKLPQRQIGPRLWAGPSGTSDAALGALQGMIHLAYPADSAGVRPNAFWDEADQIGQLADHLHGPNWDTTTAMVDETAVTFHIRARNGAWAAVADLGQVAVGAYGHSLQLSAYPLEAVSNLDAYSILPGRP